MTAAIHRRACVCSVFQRGQHCLLSSRERTLVIAFGRVVYLTLYIKKDVKCKKPVFLFASTTQRELNCNF